MQKPPAANLARSTGKGKGEPLFRAVEDLGLLLVVDVGVDPRIGYEQGAWWRGRKAARRAYR